MAEGVVLGEEGSEIVSGSIITGDCLEILPTLESKSFDFAFTDVPYNVGKDYGLYKDNLPKEEWISLLQKVFVELDRITKNGFVVLIGAKGLREVWNLVPESKLVVVHKKAIGFRDKNYFWQYFGLLCTAKPVKTTEDLWNDVRLIGEGYFCREETFGHPGRTSDELTRKVLETFTIVGDSVLDPFSGVGTTAVCCKELGRNWMGIELNEEYNKVALQRLSETKEIKSLGLEGF